MNKNKIRISLISLFFIITVGSISNLPVRGGDFPEEEQISLTYDVINWEDTEWGTSWTIWENGSVYKGNFSSNPGGKIEITITGMHEKNQSIDSFEAFENVNFPYYGSIDIFKKENETYLLNFSLTNISFNEIGYTLIYGYGNWNPSFKISTDWENNAIIALSKKESLWANATVSIINTSTTVTYDFQQIGGLEQKTILTYNKTNGILLEAITEFSQYSSHIRLQGYNPNPIIPGYEISVLFVATILGILVILRRKKIEK